MLFESVLDEIDTHPEKYTLDGVEGLKEIQRDDEVDFSNNSNNASMVGS